MSTAIEIDIGSARAAAAAGRSYTANGVMLAHGGEEDLDLAIAAFLAAIGKEQLAGPVGYCMREIVSNTVKANAKRTHFLAQGIELHDPAAYAEGMRSFRRGLDENRLAYFRLAEERGLSVRIAFEPGPDRLLMSVANNAPMTAEEAARVADRLARAHVMESVEEAMSIIDDTEGAGLGIIILALTLKKLGLGGDALSLGAEGSETVARLAIPSGLSRDEQFNHLSDGLSQTIGALPQFPEHLARLRGMLEDPMSRLVEMARHVAADPGLSAEVLRLANSPLYRNAGRIENLANAVLRIGVNGMMGIVLAQGVQALLGGKGGAGRCGLGTLAALRRLRLPHRPGRRSRPAPHGRGLPGRIAHRHGQDSADQPPSCRHGRHRGLLRREEDRQRAP
jgi:hypothetical protein